MRKTLIGMTILVVSLFAAMTMVSCGDDNDKNGGGASLSGLYSASNGIYKGTSFKVVYNFINNNTVIDYSSVSNSSSGWTSGTEIETIPGHSGWYYASSSMRYRTYYILDNKVFLSNGTILTISGSSLLMDDSNFVFTKW